MLWRRQKVQRRSVSKVTRRSHTLFLFVIAFSSVVLFMTSRMLRSYSKPLKVYMRFAGSDPVLENKLIDGLTRGENVQDTQMHNVIPVAQRIYNKDSYDLSMPLAVMSQTNDIDVMRLANSKLTSQEDDATLLCQKSSLFLLVLIFSEEPMTSLRNLIRHTWCKRQIYSNDRRVTCLFLIGQDSSKQIFSDDVKREALEHGDIILMSLRDDFRNSTLKLITGMKWVESNCQNFRYVLRTEDDVIVNMEKLMEKVLINLPEKQFAGGKCRSDVPIRNEFSKFYVSFDDYPQERYPPVCNYMGYILSSDVFHSIHRVSLPSRIIPLDDVYVGVLLRSIDVIPRNMEIFLYQAKSTSNDVICNYVIIHSHINTAQNAIKVWEVMRNECS